MLLACGGEETTGPPPPPPPETPRATSISITPASVSLTALGDTVRLAAEVRDQNGRAIAGATVTWASGDPSVAAVNASGLVTAEDNGSTAVTATAGSASETASVMVMQVADRVAVTPPGDTLVAGDTLRLSAEAFDAKGHGVANASFTWASSDAGVAVVDTAGLVTGEGAGEAEITATAGPASAGARLVVVAAEPTTVSVTPDSVELAVLGDTVRLQAEVRDQLGRPMTGTAIAWTSGDASVAAVDSAGLVRAVGNGTATITARAGTVSASAEVTVTQLAASVAVTPNSGQVEVGLTLQLSAGAFDAGGSAIPNATFSWSSSDETVATVDSTGLVRGVADGTAIITAVSGDAEGTAEIVVGRNADREALTALYEVTDGPNWVNNDNWLTDRPLGEWYGVAADSAGVVGLVLSENGLSGTIPSHLGLLKSLKVLNLSRNGAMAGSRFDASPDANPDLAEPAMPESSASQGSRGPFGRRRSGSTGRGLTGPIPPELGNLANLDTLALNGNNLSGPLPEALGDLSSLRSLHLGDNRLAGSIPAELGGIESLRVLYLNNNSLSGSIPPELGSLPNLAYLALWQNNLSGRIPPELGNLASLEAAYLTDNDLSGPIPPELGSLPGLRHLFLWGNRLSGPIPSALGSLASLTDLHLSGNELSGPIPAELGNLSSLRVMFLSWNKLSGSIPESFLDLRALERFGFSGNADLCAPGTSGFAAWLEGIEETYGPYCNESDMGVLERLYETSGGPDWTNSGGWLETPALAEWYGVTANSLGRVVVLDLAGNGLTGELMADLGSLVHLTALRIGDNALTGRLPLSLADLPPLDELHYSGTGLCAPMELRSWLDGIPSHEGAGVTCGPHPDRDALRALYAATRGTEWRHSKNWLTDAPLGEWHGVDTDGFGSVVGLELRDNNLTGPIPLELGNLAAMKLLNLGNNYLTGPIPSEIGQLSALETLLVNGTTWSTQRLTGPIPPELENLQALETLRLNNNALTGPIPPELGNLPSLRHLDLRWNELSGPTPTELGDLAELRLLDLGSNRLSGPIPPELAELPHLQFLLLGDNELTGAIPPELGDAPNLRTLGLPNNTLSGPIPPALGNLAALENLLLDNNELTGSVPPELGSLARLRQLSLTNNTDLAGALPTALTALGQLDALLVGGTGLCAPPEPGFRRWMEGVRKRRIQTCEEGTRPAAYLVQAAQSREFPVPLVAGEKAMLRVFPTAAENTSARIPAVRARFYRDGQESFVANIPGQSTPIPTEVDEGNWSRSVNAEVPARLVRPGLEMVIEVDPNGTLDSGLGVARRIPEVGRMAMEVTNVPTFYLTVIPFLWSPKPDSLVLEITGAMAEDPQSHELLDMTRTLLPIQDIVVMAHEPVASSSNNARALLRDTEAIRVIEGEHGYYLGTMTGEFEGIDGLAAGVPGWSSFSTVDSGDRSEYVIAHELGHNMNLAHPPGCEAGGPDYGYPYEHGRIGVWGYDFDGERLVPPVAGDVMSYCPGDWDEPWIGEYHFTNALRYRLAGEGETGASAAGTPRQSLLLWGGVDAEGSLFLEPAFVVEAPPTLPDSAGEYRIVGHAGDGGELFGLSFDMTAVADGNGSSSFAFALPVRPGWEDRLASITLTGPGGSVTLDGESDLPAAILRDPRTGRIRGILRKPPGAAGTLAEAVAALSPEPGLDVLLSRGIPDARAWRPQERE